MLVPGGCRPPIKEYLSFRSDLQFLQSPDGLRPYRRLKLEITPKSQIFFDLRPATPRDYYNIKKLEMQKTLETYQEFLVLLNLTQQMQKTPDFDAKYDLI